MIAELQAFLVSKGASSVLLLFAGIVLLSYLSEDLAIVTAGSLAAQGNIQSSVALLAIFVGIASGDLGLYFLGHFGRRSRYLRYKALTNRYFKVLRTRLQKGTFINLFVIRFVPGLRTIGFTLSGFFAIPLPFFMFAVLSATALWTMIVFSSIYYLGSIAWLQASQYQWMLIPIGVGILFIINRFVNKSLSKGHS